MCALNAGLYCFPQNPAKVNTRTLLVVDYKHTVTDYLYKLGTGRYEKYVYREAANAKPYQIWDSVFQYTPNKQGCFLNNVTIKAQKCTKYAIKMSNIFICPIFYVFLHLYELTSEIEVIKCHNQNMAVLLNVSLIEVCK